jgi:hypothetical protein
MRLPNAEEAIIEEKKIRDYLLSFSHPIGRFKAAIFLHLGYNSENWRQLEIDFREQHLPCEAEEIGTNRYGTKYKIEAPLKGPNGKAIEMTSIWVIEDGEDRPRLVTVYPGG